MIRTLENKQLRITVKPSGAELVSLYDLEKNVEYLWQGDPEYWARRAPVLFPIVGKLNSNTCKIDGKEYILPQHGFARNLIFDLVQESENSLSYLLKYNEETLKIYPFKFELYIHYELEGRKLKITYKVINSDAKEVYFSIGGHPAFNVPVFEGESFEDYFIQFPEKETLERNLLSGGLLTEKKEKILNEQDQLHLKREYFDKDAIVLLSLKSNSLCLKSRKSEYRLKMDFEGFPYFGIWSPPGNAPFICLEPWDGHADYEGYEGEFKDKEGVLKLAPQEEYLNSFQISF